MRSYKKELEEALRAAELARREVLKYFRNPSLQIETKSDNSPVTEADKAADKVIREHLSKKFPDYGFLTEESEDDKTRLQKEYVWIIDPIDGTESFIDGRDDFSILIALSRNHEIVVGVLAVPARKEVYFASKYQGAFKQNKDYEVKQIHVNFKSKNITALKSPHHSVPKEDELIEKHKDKITKIIEVGSAFKMALIAEGIAEITYRLGSHSKEWDIAAPYIIIKEAGGVFLKPNKEKITFNKEDFINHEGYIVCNRKKNFLL